MIDLSKTYTLEQKPKRGDLSGLDNYGMSKMPGTSTFFFAQFDDVSKKYKTGLDINSREILSLKDTVERKNRQDAIKQIIEDVEAYYGQPGILNNSPKLDDAGNPTANFWDRFGITVTVGQNLKTYIEVDGKTFTLNPTTNPIHRLALIVLDANDFLPKNKVDAGSPHYHDAKFLLTTEEEEEKESKETIRKEIARGKYLSVLFGDSVQYERAWEIAYFLGLKPKNGVGESKLQEMLYMATKEPMFLNTFIKVSEMENEEIITANLFKKGVNLGIIKYNAGDKTYFRGGINYRDTEDGSIELLKTPAMATELAQLREKVIKLSKGLKNLA